MVKTKLRKSKVFRIKKTTNSDNIFFVGEKYFITPIVF